MMRKFAALVGALLLVAAIADGLLAQAQDRVRITQLGTRADRTTVVFTLGTSAGADTTFNFNPATFMSIVGQAHSTNDSVDITATMYCGVSDEQMVSDDVWEIEQAGTFVQMVYLPVTLRANVVFTAGPNNGSDTTIDSVWVARQW